MMNHINSVADKSMSQNTNNAPKIFIQGGSFWCEARLESSSCLRAEDVLPNCIVCVRWSLLSTVQKGNNIWLQ